MHKRARFSTGEVPTVTDLNRAGGEYTEGILTEFVKAISSTDAASILFWNEAPSISDTGSEYELIVPTQWFSINGVAAKIEEDTLTLEYGDTQYGIYFVVGRTETEEERDILDSGVITPDDVVTYDSAEARIVVTSSVDHETSPPEPTLGDLDIGYILYATVTSDSPTEPVVAHNTDAVWRFPGNISPADPHGEQHTSDGSDPIPIATSTTSGLMSAGMKMYLDFGLRGASGSAPVAVAIASGTRKLTVSMNFNSSLTLSGSDLALNYLTASDKNGSSSRPSRSDHKHEQAELPYTIYETSIDVSSSDLGVPIELEYTGTSNGVTPIGVLWAPTELSSIRLPCDLLQVNNGTVGATILVTGVKNFAVIPGSYGFAKLPSSNPAAVALLGDLTGIDTADNTTVLRSGTLFVRVLINN